MSGELPDDDGWTGAEIKECCRKAGRLRLPLVRAAQYTVPISKSAAEQIKSNPSYQLTVGPRIKDKAEELSNTNPTAATTLINDALKMDPPLKDNYISEIHLIQEKLKQKASRI